MLKKIAVVGPGEYAFLGKKLAEEISGMPDFYAFFKLVKDYRDNFDKVDNTMPTIFLGNPRENYYTRKFLDKARVIKNRSGACYGYVNSTAMVFGDGNFESAFEIKELFKKYENIFLTMNKISRLPLIKMLPGGFSKASKNVFFIYLLKLLQTDAASAFFLTDFFDQWVEGFKR